MTSVWAQILYWRRRTYVNECRVRNLFADILDESILVVRNLSKETHR